jgi:hypothetical protein
MTTPEMRALIKAAEELRQDLLMRGEHEKDGTIVVNASHGRWMRFCEALREAKVKHG